MHALSIDHLHKTYKNGVHALKGISFTVEQGDFFALLGPNGAGKSTTIGILTSLVTKTSGTVRIYDHDIDDDFAQAKRLMGVVPQEFNFSIFETPMEILLNQAGYYGLEKSLAKERAEYYLNQLNLWDKRHTVSRMLSGGMKRRLMIARGLIHEPRLLILDEPTAGVDIEIRRSMWHFLQNINAQGTTIILTTHYLEEAENLCNTIAIINHGHLIENTSMKSLLKTLDIETFILYLKEPLHFAPELSQCTCRLLDETTLEVDIPKEKAANDVFAELSTHHITVLSLRNKTNRLEELFVGMTSQSHV